MTNHYSNIVELPLRNFINCLVDGNIYALVISGKPTDDELTLAWVNIQQEYADAMGDGEHKMYYNCLKELTLLAVQYNVVQASAETLREIYVEASAKEINRILLTTYAFDSAKPEEYYKEIEYALRRSKGLKLEYDLKAAAFTELQKNYETKGGKPTKEYFVSILITLTDHAKVHIEDSITVFEFCERIKRFNQYCSDIEKLNNGK